MRLFIFEFSATQRRETWWPMKHAEILTRLTGVSCPIFGISWNPPEAERSIAHRSIAYLEDRRVLFAPWEMEVPEFCVRSVEEIRHFLTQEIAQMDQDNHLAKSLRAMRLACRKFMDSVVAPGGNRPARYFHMNGMRGEWMLMSALGEIRGVFGIHVAQIAAEYGLDVEDDLASIMPANEKTETEEE